MTASPSGVIYVFLALPHETDRRLRVDELKYRCFVARGFNQDCKTIVGIATEQKEHSKGSSYDLSYLYKEDWTEKDQSLLEYIQEKLGYFTNLKQSTRNDDEYPICK